MIFRLLKKFEIIMKMRLKRNTVVKYPLIGKLSSVNMHWCAYMYQTTFTK